ncbi:MAG: thioredoxin family protein, partial [Bacilli bacterium]|nr:thioredoxin family protein [Bacilli bacterium]
NNKEYVHVEINKNNPFVYASFDEVIDTLKNGTGVIYFGFPECPWCRNMVSVLLDAANEMGIDKIYYFNALEMRDIKSLNEDGSIKIDKAGTDEYYELISALGDSIGAYEGLNDDSIKRLYFPTVVFVKNGKILSSHIGTLDSQTDPYKTLSSSQKNELKEIYMSGINKVYEIMCDEAC